MDHKQHPLLVTFRWVAFIPGGILIGALGSTLILAFLGGSGPDNTPIRDILSCLAFGYFGVSVGAKIAPCPSKVVPGTVLATLLVLLGVATIILSVIDREWVGVFGGVCIIAASILGLVAIVKEWP